MKLSTETYSLSQRLGDAFLAALTETDYQEEFTLEALSWFRNVPEDFLLDAAAYAQKAGRYLISRAARPANI